jgi:hypothetical protein
VGDFVIGGFAKSKAFGRDGEKFEAFSSAAADM